MPTVVVVEDIHWADPAMLELLEDLADRGTGPILLLCTARPELTMKRPSWGGMRRSYTGLRVDPIGERDSAQMLDALMEINVTTGPDREAIIARAEGNPFFLEEIVRTLRSGAAGAARIPDTVQAALAARIDLLPSDEKRALHAAAVVGRVFWPGPIGEIASIDREVVDELLDRLQGHDLIAAGLASTMRTQQEFTFRHALVRDVAYGSLPRRDRVGMHTRVADWIERTYAGRRDEVIELIAHHRAAAYWLDESAELRESAFDSSVEAAENAYGRSAVESAITLAEDAVRLAAAPLERARALELLGRAAHALFHASKAWVALREAADIVHRETPWDRARIAAICGRAVIIPAREMGMMSTPVPAAEVAPYLALGLECAGDADSEALILLLASEGSWDFGFAVQPTATDTKRGHRAAERAREIARRLGRPDLELMALDALGVGQTVHGRFGLIEQFDRERLQIVRGIRDPFEIADTYYSAAWTALEVGRYAESVALGELFENVTTGSPVGPLALRSLARVPLGEWDAALADQARLRELLADRALSPPSYASAGFGAEVLIRTARREDAVAEAGLAEMWQWARQGKRTQLWPLPSMAIALARRGDFTGSHHLLDELSPYEMSRPRRLEALCTVTAEEGAWDKARALVIDSRHVAEAGRLIALGLHADRLEGRALAASGDVEQAITSLERAAAAFMQLQARWELALTRLSLGEALAALDRYEEARRVLDPGVQEFQRLRVPRELERAQTLLNRIAGD